MPHAIEPELVTILIEVLQIQTDGAERRMNWHGASAYRYAIRLIKKASGIPVSEEQGQEQEARDA